MSGGLLGSGLVGGEGLIGVIIAAAADWLALALFVALIAFFWRHVAPAEPR